tara:strand:- start:74 stop:715 length:642 start_codon:yes stop_codon:yes gene_type:complete
MKGYKVLPISYSDTKPFILHIHYAKRMPSITYSFGLFYQNELVGVVCYGSPASQSLCRGIAGDTYKNIVLELNRLVLKNNIKNEASFLVGNSFKFLPQPRIIVSYADTSQNHNGYIYQATNFIYTGLSDKRTEWRKKNSNLHPRWLNEKRKENPDDYHIVQRPQKHRYIYIVANKKDKKNLLKKLNYPILDYPKFQNKNYKTDTNITTQGLLI